MNRLSIRRILGVLVQLFVVSPFALAEEVKLNPAYQKVRYSQETIQGVNVFYREAGLATNPAVVLLHGFPTSSHMFREIIPSLAEKYHVIAPDYPGFGHSDSPDRGKFEYTFDNYAMVIEELLTKLEVKQFALYVMDYGAPIGFRIAARHPEKVTALIVQNGNAYDEGLAEFWDPIRAYWNSGKAPEREAIRWLTSLKATKWQYTNGAGDLSLVSPDGWTYDQTLLDRPGNQEIQLDLFYDYRTNLPHYPEWQAYFKEYQPPTLVVWGKNDAIFVAAGAAPYARDNKNAEVHLLNTGHFALETHGAHITALMMNFLERTLQ